jgi:hypothetical protein
MTRSGLLVLVFLAVGCTGTTHSDFGADSSTADSTPDGQEDPALDPVTADADADAQADPGLDSVTVDADSDAATDPDSASDHGEDLSETLRGSGTWDDPFMIVRLPFLHADDTRDSTERQADSYSCAPDTNEAGAEIVYRIEPPRNAIIVAAIDDTELPGVDVDVHLLDGADAEACLARDHIEVSRLVLATESYWLVIDTWVNDGGEELPGPYLLTVEEVAVPSGNCALESDAIEMINRDDPLPMPTFGPVVMEAHLVTDEEFSGLWPTALRDGIPEHYLLSEGRTGYEMSRREPWAPEGEGGSEWGQGSTTRPPVLDEAWYVNMYWRRRPARGTRMLVYNPRNGRAVVTAGGYETGPGAATAIGGACEEIHDHLGSSHRSSLLMGFLVDQELPLGPIDCD